MLLRTFSLQVLNLSEYFDNFLQYFKENEHFLLSKQAELVDFGFDGSWVW